MKCYFYTDLRGASAFIKVMDVLQFHYRVWVVDDYDDI